VKAIYVRNVPDEAFSRLQGLASRAGLSLNGFVVGELAAVAGTADGDDLPAELPDLGLSSSLVLHDLHAGRDSRGARP
jgi:hypothetical protein